MRWNHGTSRLLDKASLRPRLDLRPDLAPIRGLVGASSGIDDAVPVWESPGPGYLMAAVASVDAEFDGELAMANHAAAQLLDTLRFQGPDILESEPQDGVVSLHFQHIGDDEVDELALEAQGTSLGALMFDGVEQRVRLLWGGRARIYFLDSVALHRLTFDDIPVATPSGEEPARLLRTVDVSPDTPGVLIACTPGAYGTWSAPWVFEQALVSAFRNAESWPDWVDVLHRSIGQHTSLSASFVVIPWGASEYQSVRSDVLGPGGSRLCDVAARESKSGDESWLQAWLGGYGPVHERWRLNLAHVPDDGEAYSRAIQSNASLDAEMTAAGGDIGERPPGWEKVASSLQMLSAEWSMNQQDPGDVENTEADVHEYEPLLPGTPLGAPLESSASDIGSNDSQGGGVADGPVKSTTPDDVTDASSVIGTAGDAEQGDGEALPLPSSAAFDALSSDASVDVVFQDSVHDTESSDVAGVLVETTSDADAVSTAGTSEGDEAVSAAGTSEDDEGGSATGTSEDDEAVSPADADPPIAMSEDVVDDDAYLQDMLMAMDSDTIRIPSLLLKQDAADDDETGKGHVLDFPASISGSLVPDLGGVGPDLEQAPPDLSSMLNERDDVTADEFEAAMADDYDPDETPAFQQSNPKVWIISGALVVFFIAGALRLANSSEPAGPSDETPTAAVEELGSAEQIDGELTPSKLLGQDQPSETAPDSVVDGVPALARGTEKGASVEAANVAPANGAETQDGALVEDEYETIIVDEPEMDEPAMDEPMGENSAPDEVVARKLADADTSSLGGADKATDAVATARMGNGTDENLGEGAEDFAGRPTTLAEAERVYLVTAETVKDVAVEGPVDIDPEDNPTADTATDLGSEDGIDALVDDFYVKTNAYLVLRKWASARSKKVWVIPKNTVVSVIGRRDDTRWIKVRYQHRVGWIAWVKNRVTPEGQPFNIDDLEIVAR